MKASHCSVMNDGRVMGPEASVVSRADEESMQTGSPVSACARNDASRAGFFLLGKNQVCHRYEIK